MHRTILSHRLSDGLLGRGLCVHRPLHAGRRTHRRPSGNVTRCKILVQAAGSGGQWRAELRTELWLTRSQVSISIARHRTEQASHMTTRS